METLTQEQMNAFTREQREAINKLFEKLPGVAHELVGGISKSWSRQAAAAAEVPVRRASAPVGIARLSVDHLLDEIITTDPLRTQLDLSLATGLTYILNGKYRFRLTSVRSEFAELTFRLRPALVVT